MAKAKAKEAVQCPQCGGDMVLESRPDSVQYKGQAVKLRLKGHWCLSCGEGILEAEALKKSEQAVLELRAKVEGVLGPAEVATIRERLQLSQRKAGELLGGGPRAFQKYEAGTQQVSLPMTNLLRLLARDPLRLKELLALASD
jgi:HTH-type transcriptional regulator / antitoxin MqsA